ncbi:MAG: hypothetical protein IJJ26_07300, partial [Victivallales bacterium]|nr:hypothetical protein [Victivallales bacterium]
LYPFPWESPPLRGADSGPFLLEVKNAPPTFLYPFPWESPPRRGADSGSFLDRKTVFGIVNRPVQVTVLMLWVAFVFWIFMRVEL